MTIDEFRHLALSFPGATESLHMKHPDFRTAGKVFATLGYPQEGWGMVKLTPEQQHDFIERATDVFQPAAGAWGRAGCTTVLLESADLAIVEEAMRLAFRQSGEKSAPKKPRKQSRLRSER
jgi:hypothetical protein